MLWPKQELEVHGAGGRQAGGGSPQEQGEGRMSGKIQETLLLRMEVQTRAKPLQGLAGQADGRGLCSEAPREL